MVEAVHVCCCVWCRTIRCTCSLAPCRTPRSGTHCCLGPVCLHCSWLPHIAVFSCWAFRRYSHPRAICLLAPSGLYHAVTELWCGLAHVRWGLVGFDRWWGARAFGAGVLAALAVEVVALLAAAVVAVVVAVTVLVEAAAALAAVGEGRAGMVRGWQGSCLLLLGLCL